MGKLGNPSHPRENFLSLSLWSGRLGPLSPLPPYPIEFLASGSWRQLGRPTNFSPGHFLTPPHPPVLSFLFPSLSLKGGTQAQNVFCSLTTSKFFVQVTPGLHCPLLRAGAGGRVRLCPAGPESIRPLPWPLRPIEAPAKPGAGSPPPPNPLHSRPQLSFLDASAESQNAAGPWDSYLGLTLAGGTRPQRQA